MDAVRRERARETVDDVAGSNRGRTKRCNDARDVSRARASGDDDVATSDERRLVCGFHVWSSRSTSAIRRLVVAVSSRARAGWTSVGARLRGSSPAAMVACVDDAEPLRAASEVRSDAGAALDASLADSETLRGELARLLAKAAPSADADARAARARGWTRVSTTLPRRALSARRRWTRSSRASARSTARGTRACVRCASRARSARRAWWPTRSPPPASPTATPP